MTQNEKDLLLKDLCARLPYGVNCKIYHKYRYYDMKLSGVFDNEVYFTDDNGSLYIDYENIKPYLFPLSSMTDEQVEEYNAMYEENRYSWRENIIDWFNKNHFDYRNLIDKNLAIDCTNLNIY